MEKAQMLNVLDAYIHMLNEVYGEACPQTRTCLQGREILNSLLRANLPEDDE